MLTLFEDAMYTVIDCLFSFSYFHLYITSSTIHYFFLFLFPLGFFYSSNCSCHHRLFSYWLLMLYFDNAKRIHIVHLLYRERKGEKARQTTEVKREALAHLTKRVYRQIYTHTDTHTHAYGFSSSC